jgi:hypothetical protein
MTITKTSPKLTNEEILWTSRQPSNMNYLRTNGFLFSVMSLPKVSYFCQAANIPSLTLGTAIQQTPLVDAPHPGDKLVIGELSIRFKVQQNLENFMEIYTWLVGLGFPTNREEFKAYVKSQQYRYPQIKQNRESPQLSDAILMALDSSNNPIAQFYFEDCFPTSLSNMDFSISEGQAEYFQATATFAFTHYTPQSLVV